MVKKTNKVIEKKEKTQTEKSEIAYGQQMVLVKGKNSYITNLINGRYFLARCNMIAEQIHTGKIKETIDGCPKPEEFMRAEYAMQKKQAIVCMREAHFAKQDLIKDFKLTEEDFQNLEEDYYNGKIIREDYDDVYKKGNKAEFIDSQKD